MNLDVQFHDSDRNVIKRMFDHYNNLLALQETAAAKEQLKAIENRHAEFLKLEKSIAEVIQHLDLRNIFFGHVVLL